MSNKETLKLFSSYISLTNVASLSFDQAEDEKLENKVLGIVNGSSWITLWSTYFGSTILPGVKLVNVGNEATQLNFMKAHSNNEECPPKENIKKTCNYAKDLCELYMPDAILLTCSTMNRSYPFVVDAVKQYNIPVIQIDEPMMVKAVETGKNILVIATHGPTVESTKALLRETAEKMNIADINYYGETIEEAFDALGEGDVRKHNQLIADSIRKVKETTDIDCVVLAQLSMSVFKIEYPNPIEFFGVEVLTSGECGFEHVKRVLKREGK